MKNQNDLTPVSADVRAQLFDEARLTIQKLAWDKIYRENKSPGELVFICIDTQSTWHALAKHLDNDGVIQTLQTPTVVTLLVGCVDLTFYEILSSLELREEDIHYVRESTPAPGMVKYLILDDHGINIRDVLPKNRGGLQ